MTKCTVCKSKFEPFVEGQKYCSGTCCRVMKDIDELERLYRFFNINLSRGCESQQVKRKGEQTNETN